MSVNILATADNHIGFRQYGLLKREKDIQDSFRNILELAVERNSDAITVSGDILHSIRPTSATIGFLKECNDFLESYKIPCLVSVGNHDQSSPHWLTNISSDNEGGFVVLDDQTFNVKGVNVYGKSFTNREEFDQGHSVPEDTDLLLMHQPFDEFSTFPNDKLFNCDDLRHVTADVVVVGDIHIHRSFHCVNQDKFRVTEVLSPGSTELMSEPEQADKYVMSLTFDEDKPVDIKAIPLMTRIVLRLEVRSEEDLESCIGFIKQKEAMEPLVFLKFSTSVENVMTRLRTLFDSSKIIIRPKPIIEHNGVELVAEDPALDLTYADVLTQMLPTKSPVYTTVSKLLDSNADVHSILDEFIEKRSKDIENDLDTLVSATNS